MMNFLKESPKNGESLDNVKTSGKRVAGFLMLIVLIVIAGLGLFFRADQTPNVLWPLVTLTSVLFGSTAIEKRLK